MTKRLKSLPPEVQAVSPPDLHPDDPAAEEHFKEVQAAYSEIMRIKQGGGATAGAIPAGRRRVQRSGQSRSQGGYGQQYQNPFGGAGFGLGRSASAITAPAVLPGGKAMAALPVTRAAGGGKLYPQRFL